MSSQIMMFFWTKTLKDKPKKKLSTLRSSRQCPWPQVTPTATFHLFGATKNTHIGRFRQTPGVGRDATFARTLAAFGAWTPSYGEISGDETCHRFPAPLEIHQDQEFLHVPPEVGPGWDFGIFVETKSLYYAVYSNMEKRWPSQTLRWLSTVVAPHTSLKTTTSERFYRFWL